MQLGWILDVSPVADGMCVWIIDDEGRAQSYIDPWGPHFYLKAQPGSESTLEDLLKSFQAPIDIAPTQKKDFFDHTVHAVLRVSMQNPLFYSYIVNRLRTLPEFELFHADIPLGQYYFYERGLFPLAYVAFETDENNYIRSWELRDSPMELQYKLPPLRFAHLELESPIGKDVWVSPTHRPRGRFILTLGEKREEGTSYAMDASEEDLIRSLNRRIADWDPDILLTEGGDDYLMARLQFHANRTGVSLRFSREVVIPAKAGIQSLNFIQKKVGNLDSGFRRNDGRSYMTYGKTVYQAGARTLFGRLHIDRKNSFAIGNTGLYGLFEIARVAKIPIQRAARCTIGTSLSSMQHEWAIRHDVLVPLDKGQTEDFRTADEFIASDRGGLVYEPEVGWHEDVIEFDFSSMYPEIMIRHNVTPEAVNCRCCPDNKVPGLNHHLCRTRGMVPDVLEPIVKKRGQYKQLIKAGHPQSAIFKQRYDAFKWALVCCFGYLGFRNARFGKIEAHECVNAYSRETLLRAKEVAEEEGYHFLHAIVDSLWLKKDGATDDDVERLRQKIVKETGLPLGLEGRYRWIHFCESKQKKGRGVPNRYYGAFTDGQLKFRGIELRRHDTPLIVKQMQRELLDKMATAHNLEELRKMAPQLAEIHEKYSERLRLGLVTPAELAISKHLTQRPEDYLHDTLSVLAAKKMAASGIQLHAGETISYIVTEEKDKVKDWRVTPLAFIEDGFEYDHTCYQKQLVLSAQTLYSKS